MNYVEFTWDTTRQKKRVLVNVDRILYILPNENEEDTFTLVMGSEETITVKIKWEVLCILLEANAYRQ